MLKKCMGDHSLIVPTENFGIKYSLFFEEILVQILDHQVRKLRMKEGASIKVIWKKQLGKLKKIRRSDIHISLNQDRMLIKVLNSLLSTL